MADTSEELIGGRYALGELLGVGGTGSVFAAADVGAGASSRFARSATEGGAPVAERGAARRDEVPAADAGAVAVKLLHPHLCADEAARDAFLREAAQVGGLQHPNIVRVHAAGLHDAAGVTMPWIALDLLDGPTLREWVDATGRLSPTDAATLADALLAGLAAAHEAGIVHRDISPQNVILHGFGTGEPLTADMVRIVDFGLADVTGRSTLGSDVLLSRSAVEPVADASSRYARSATETGARSGAGTGSADGSRGGSGVVGNAAYMSPEQAQGLPMRAASDLYQAGAVFYFALTGRAPYSRDTTTQVLQAHLSAPPPVPSALVREAQPFDRAVTRAMAKQPLQRFRNAEEFRAAVQSAAARIGAIAGSLETVDARGDIDPAGVAAGGGGPGVPSADPATRVLSASRREPADASWLAPVADAYDSGSAPATRSNGGAAAVIAGAVILGLAGWAVVAAAASPSVTVADPTASPSASASVTASSTPTPSDIPVATPQPSAPSTVPSEAPRIEVPVDVAVPVLYGTLGDVEAALRAVGLTLGAVTRIESAEAAERMLSQQPSAGERVLPGTVVHVTVASGNNVVPQVGGMTVASATAMLQSAGFAVEADRSSTPSSKVAFSLPAASTVVRVGVTVTLVIDTSTPTPGATTSPSPDSGASS